MEENWKDAIKDALGNTSVQDDIPLIAAIKAQPIVTPLRGYGTQEPFMPPNLDELATLGQVVVQQQPQWLERLSGMDRGNCFIVTDLQGNILYKVQESSDCLLRALLWKWRPFQLELTDRSGNQVLSMSRSFTLGLPWLPLRPGYMLVQTGGGGVLGGARACPVMLCHCAKSCQDILSLLGRHFTVHGTQGDPLCCIQWTPYQVTEGSIKMKILSNEGVVIGGIIKQKGSIITEMMADADTFLIIFPEKAETTLKTLILAACFLIDSIYFEKSSW